MKIHFDWMQYQQTIDFIITSSGKNLLVVSTAEGSELYLSNVSNNMRDVIKLQYLHLIENGKILENWEQDAIQRSISLLLTACSEFTS